MKVSLERSDLNGFKLTFPADPTVSLMFHDLPAISEIGSDWRLESLAFTKDHIGYVLRLNSDNSEKLYLVVDLNPEAGPSPWGGN